MTVELLIDGTRFSGWTSVRVTRGLDRAAADFNVEVTERWPRQDQPWIIAPGAACRVLLDGDVVIDGHVDSYAPSFSASSHMVAITGRSKTADLVDCSVRVPGGQFRGYDLAQVARALAAPFGIPVRVEVGDLGAPFEDVQVQQGETGWELIERLCRLRSVLATDGPDGALVLTRAGAARAAAITDGADGTILEGSASLTLAERFSEYTVLGQQSAADAETSAQAIGRARDLVVPRYRPRILIAEGAVDNRAATVRARWEAAVRTGRSTQADITVQGWFDADGARWDTNRLTHVRSPWLGLDRDLLITEVTYTLSDQGSLCRMTLVPPEAFREEPSDDGGSGEGRGLWTRSA